MDDNIEEKLNIQDTLNELLELATRLSQQARNVSTSEQEVMNVVMAPIAAKIQTGEALHPKILDRLEHTSFDHMLDLAAQHRDKLLDLADKLDTFVKRADEVLTKIDVTGEGCPICAAHGCQYCESKIGF